MIAQKFCILNWNKSLPPTSFFWKSHNNDPISSYFFPQAPLFITRGGRLKYRPLLFPLCFCCQELFIYRRILVSCAQIFNFKLMMRRNCIAHKTIFINTLTLEFWVWIDRASPAGTRLVHQHWGVRLPAGAVCGHPPGQTGGQVQHHCRHAAQALLPSAGQVCGGGGGQPHDARDCPGRSSLPPAPQGN